MATAGTRGVEAARGEWRGDDFPAWVSPMLVKELRQGIQSGAFAWTFMGLQAVMFLVMATVLAGGGGPGADGLAPTFWLPVVVAVAIVIPLRGLGAVSSEKAGNNLDLVRLTHLSATRIVIGKWLAIVAQSALLATAALPYLVLRYFLGGVNVVRDLVAFGWMLAAAMLVAAAAVAASTRPVRERIGLVVLLFMLGNGLLQALVFSFAMGAGGMRFPPLVGLGLVGLYTVVFLEHAAAAIAPPAENHAARKRLVGLAIAAAWLGTAALGGRNLFWIVAGGTIVPLVAMAVEALCERPSRLASIHAAFAGRGPAGRLAALLLVPGWASGLVFTTLAGAACIAAAVVHTLRFAPGDTDQALAVAIIAYAAVVFPLPAVALLTSTRRQHLLYAGVQVFCLFVFVFDALLGTRWASGERPVAAVALFPLAALLRAMGAAATTQFTLALGAAALTLVVYALVSGAWIRELAATCRQVEAAGPRSAVTGAEAPA